MPGTLISRSQPASWRATAPISLDRPSMRSSSRRQSPAMSSMTRTMRGDRTSEGVARMPGNSARKKRCPCRTAIAALQQEGADLIDDAGALADQSLAHAMKRLQVKLIGRLRRNELHRWTLHGLRNRVGIVEVIFLPLRIGSNILCRHQPRVVSERVELAAEMMRANAGLHADEARREVGQVAPRSGRATTSAAARSHHARSWPTTWNEFLPISIPTTAMMLSLMSGTWRAPCRMAAPRQRATAGGAGARPDHPISRFD